VSQNILYVPAGDNWIMALLEVDTYDRRAQACKVRPKRGDHLFAPCELGHPRQAYAAPIDNPGRTYSRIRSPVAHQTTLFVSV
jgi:hypothetical protein